MTTDSERLLSLALEHQDQAALHLKKSGLYLQEFASLVTGGNVKRRSGSNIKSLRVWADWLADHGPATRAEITEATGTKLTERATPHTLVWSDDLNDDDDIPANTIVRFNSVRQEGVKGRPPVVYALWSQRYDVATRYGTGPTSPPPQPFLSVEASDTLLGVVHPDDLRQGALDPEFGTEQQLDFESVPNHEVGSDGEHHGTEGTSGD